MKQARWPNLPDIYGTMIKYFLVLELYGQKQTLTK